MDFRPLTAEELLAHRDGLASLARRLVGDESRADDLVQETLLIALRRPRELVRSPAAWLGRVLLRLTRQKTREEARRRRRERAVAVLDRDHRLPARERGLAATRAVAAALEALDEPYRSTLFARYVDELSPAEIASRCGVSIRTVHTRTTRGLRLVREKLDDGHGGRRELWAAPLGAWLGGRRREPPPSLAALRAAVWVAVPLALGAAIAAWFADPRTPELAPPRSTFAVTAPAGATTRRPEGGGSRASARTAVASEAPGVPPPRARSDGASPEPERLSGRVVDERGHPVAGVPVRLEAGGMRSILDDDVQHFLLAAEQPDVAAVESDASGAFELCVPPALSARLIAGGGGYAPVLARHLPADGTAPLELVVARARSIEGRVTDADGVPVAGALVRLRPPPRIAERADERGGTWSSVRPFARTDDGGRFALSEAYALEGASLFVRRDGFRPACEDLGAPGVIGPLELRLERTPATSVQRGRVLDRRGRPVAGAFVAAASRVVRTDADGGFALDRAGIEHAARIVAVGEGALPEVLELALDARGRRVWPEGEVALRLGGEPLAIAGTVVDAAGAPVEGAFVWIRDPTELGFLGRPCFVEEVLGGTTHPISARTDAQGRFELHGLAERSYGVSALLPETLRVLHAEPMSASTRDLVLRLDTDGPRMTLAGRVVARDGEALAGVRVVALRPVSILFSAAGRTRTTTARGLSVATDERGRFALVGLADDAEIRLEVRGDGLFETELARIRPEERESLEVVAGRRARLVVVPSPGVPELRLRFADGDGRPARFLLAPSLDRARPDAFERELTVGPGDGPRELHLPDTVREVVVVRPGGAEERVDVALDGGGVTYFEL